MFPLQHCGELFFQEPSIPQQDLKNLIPKKSSKRQRISKSGVQENSQNEETNENKVRKIMHRDIERKRRQEMTNLYALLRDLLPLEYIKGKRSISDHMHEAVNYIKHMERNVKELRMRRDKLRDMILSSSGSENGSLDSISLPNCVTVNSSWGGVEILINCGMKEGHGFTLSRVLMELLRTELNVVCCISTKVNQRIFHRIQSEVNSLAYVNLPELQRRLLNVIS